MKFFEITSSEQLAEVKAFLVASAERVRSDRSLAERRKSVESIIEDVRTRGDEALVEYTARFDGVALWPDQIELNEAEIAEAVATVPKRVVAMLERAHEHIRAFHAKNLRESWEQSFPDGSMFGQRITPIEKAGVYVPGGKAFYPSSVLMNIVPARVAGVKTIIMVSPPSCNGSIHPAVLAAARIAGATRVFRVGGVQAIAALAHGTETIPPVIKITGPGNAYVTMAKALVRGTVDDREAALGSRGRRRQDGQSNHVAAEMLADRTRRGGPVPAVHPSKKLAEATMQRLQERMPALSRASIIEKALGAGAVMVTPDMETAVELTNLVCRSTSRPVCARVADKVVNAGAIMMGAMTPVGVTTPAPTIFSRPCAAPDTVLPCLPRISAR